MALTIDQLAKAIGARAEGNLSFEVSGLSEPATAREDQIAMAMSPAFADRLAQGSAKVAVVWAGCDWKSLGLEAAIFAPRARLAMAGLTQAFDPLEAPEGIHPTAVVHPDAELAEDVSIGAFSMIGRDVFIGEGTRIGTGVSLASGSRIGSGSLLFDGVRIGRNVVIGDRAILQFNAVVGSDGFSFVTEQESKVERARKEMRSEDTAAAGAKTWHRIHSLGGVTIGDDVEIGASSTIDAGTIRPTRIGRGTKLDNLVHVGHNVVVGEDCLLCGQVGIAGSSVIGDRSVLGGQSGVGDNLVIGSDVVITGATKVMSNVPDGRVMMGSPAVKIETHVETYKALRRLPRFMRTMSQRQKAVSNDDEKG